MPVTNSPEPTPQADTPPNYAPYDYAFVRVVPYIHRGEYVNAGVILFCRPRRFLMARIKLDETRVRALAPELDMDELRQHLALTPRICAGEGPIGALGLAESFHWLVAPHNTIVQAGPVHCGLCTEPAVALEHLLAWVPGEEFSPASMA